MFRAALTAFLISALPLCAAELGDDGLHKPEWLRETFKDLSDDLAEANSEGKRLLLLVEQRGCIYCTRMHEKVYPDAAVAALLNDHYFVVQINLFGDVDVTDFDGTMLSEKDMAVRWGVMFTPTMIFLPEAVQPGATAAEAAVALMPGAFETGTTQALLTWVRDHGYDSGEHFQKYLSSRINLDNAP
ncbi:MAG: thioredoxin family protein [Pseudotabrizicola sp.]|uniref:thioredoxin family protein n=1 Tax=Pseudotabrizicola sp. TaxID=2939647 RepID=UPI00271C7649|nr:thioredoxin family protein [Pseudotabrizicola sp.]MDO8883610.1 thioredoxin family protein [Pseudotabrizicola sp.]MDP2081263.1 thioredoxin family protein [Pseudotabrizicola sp.]MDZ7576118.1 thioredoxin family protein [Pseudotabrizicola sp.]